VGCLRPTPLLRRCCRSCCLRCCRRRWYTTRRVRFWGGYWLCVSVPGGACGGEHTMVIQSVIRRLPKYIQ
jgi:hypothetical protein